MRTRKSNRVKSYAVEAPDSSDEDASLRRHKRAEEQDASFDEPARDVGGVEDVEKDVGDTGGVEDDAVDVAELESEARKPARRRAAPSKPPAKTTRLAGGYLEIPLATQEGSHQPRTYIGPNDRAVRRHHLVSAWYGPDEERMDTMRRLLDRWFQWPVLPPREEEPDVPPRGAWLDDFSGCEGRLAAAWRERVEAAMGGAPPLRALGHDDAAPYSRFLSPTETMPVLVGPDATEVMFAPGSGHALSQGGLPFGSDEGDVASGWMFDTGGLATGVSWAPRSGQKQLLAVAVAPHADQEAHDGDEQTRIEFQAYGTVQLWEVQTDTEASTAVPSSAPPMLRRTLCLPHGRARRVEWNPAGSHLAVLCADGGVYVFEADTEGTEAFEELLNPVAALYLKNEGGVEATSMSWANVNRLVVGYSDGSVGLWSVLPRLLLARQAIHHSHVVEVATGYPSMPYVVAATPLGGTMRIFDFQAPSHEFTEFQGINVTTQPNLLAWSDQMLGFFSLYPSARVNNTVIGFMHHANFPLFRTTFTGDSFPSAIATGKTHPFLLIGLADGSVWCLNPQVEHFNSRIDATYRIRLFQHEHRPRHLFPSDSPAAMRGASRVVQGFEVEKNRNAKTESQPKGKSKKKDDEEEDEVLKSSDATRAALYEPLTRITALDWNPNEGYGCFAAAAMGSGLVRIMDLGIKN